MLVINIGDRFDISFRHAIYEDQLNIQYNNADVIGFIFDNENNLVLKMWGNNTDFFDNHNIDHHYVNGYNRLTVNGVDDV